jgi:hypothetical protein
MQQMQQPQRLQPARGGNAKFSATCATHPSSSPSASTGASLDCRLPDVNTDLCPLIKQEKARQRLSLVLIASKNFTSHVVLNALGLVMSNKYS